MTTRDYTVLVVYFLAMTAIGIASMLKVKKQEDFFLGGRGFGKILQAFAAFGAGTGSYDPVVTGRSVYTSGLSGIWSVLLWLFVTPFYWFFGVWYRRMRHLTLGDWFVERFQSKALGAVFALYGIAFFSVFLGLGFSAVGKVCAPLIGSETFCLPWFEQPVPVETVLIPVIALVVTIYGVLGGLRAAYWTDLIQGVFIILLSILLIPAGLDALVDKLGDPAAMGMMDGFSVMHEQVPDEYFAIAETPVRGDFPLHYIVAITLLNLVGIVVQPHFIAIGGGSAKTENTARIGLMAGTFMKRFCTVGWALTALIILALMADNVELAEHPDHVWGIAAREILGPFNLGLVGLMLACLIAALMSSADCYMLIISGLIVRNWFAPLVPHASEKTYLLVGRMAGVAIIGLGAGFALWQGDVFQQLKIAWELPIIFAAPFWVGMFWRRATKAAVWITVSFSAVLFFILPVVLPTAVPSLAQNQRYVATNDVITQIVTRSAAPADVARRNGEIALWEKRSTAGADQLGPRPEPILLGTRVPDTFETGGKAIYWKKSVVPVDPAVTGEEALHEIDRTEQGNLVTIRKRYRPDCRLKGQGSFNLDFVVYDLLGVPLRQMSNPALETLRLPPRLLLPFVVMILASLATKPVKREVLDRYYVKMKTPVNPDPETDRAELAKSYEDPARFDHRRLCNKFGLEIQKPRPIDFVGFPVGFAICFAIIWFTVWLAQLGT